MRSVLMVVVSSEFQCDVAVGRIVERFFHRLGKRRRADREDAFPVDHFEFVAGGQRLELVRRERRILAEEGIDLQQDIEQAVRDAHDRAACAGHALDLPDDVDVIDALQAGDVEGLPLDPRVDATDDHVAEVADVKRLAHVAPAARNRKHRNALHEARQPAQVLAVEPAEHERRPQHDAFDARGEHDFFLLAFRLGVPVLADRLHDGRTDMDGVWNVISLDHIEYAARRVDVVANERLARRRADLGLQHDDRVGAFEMPRPVARFGKIGEHGGDIRMDRAQDLEIGLVLVEHDEIGIAARFESRHEILADEACATWKNNAGWVHALVLEMLGVSCVLVNTLGHARDSRLVLGADIDIPMLG
ncbi:protein of unknown function [Ralstonia solanacearum CFBP2957]|nr:protein of unknown function [Ralstonia solanacearum CFBP2957]